MELNKRASSLFVFGLVAIAAAGSVQAQGGAVFVANATGDEVQVYDWTAGVGLADTLGTALEPGSLIASGDFDGDYVAELAIMNGIGANGTLSIVELDGTVLASRPWPVDLSWSMTAGNFDPDPARELALVDQNGNADVLVFSLENGVFSPDAVVFLPAIFTGVLPRPRLLRSADAFPSSDGNIEEILFVEENGRIGIAQIDPDAPYLNDGTSVFASSTLIGTFPGAEALAVDDRLGVGDVDGDGEVEAVVSRVISSTELELQVWDLVTGAATMSVLLLEETFTPASSLFGSSAPMTLGDVDGDGRDEILVATRAAAPDPGLLRWDLEGEFARGAALVVTQGPALDQGILDLQGLATGFPADRDADGLLDTWELLGLDADGDGVIDLDLPGLGADPDHKTIFIQLDHMQGVDPDDLDLAAVKAAFAAAPIDAGGIRNPDNLPGIDLFIDTGPWLDSTMALVGEDLGGGTEVPDDQLSDMTSKYYAIKNANLDAARRAAFHYGLIAVRPEGTSTGGNTTTTLNDTNQTWLVDEWVDEVVEITGAADQMGTSSGGNTMTTLNDTSQAWTANEWVGDFVRIEAGVGMGLLRKIKSNTGTQLVPETAWPALMIPDATSQYLIVTFDRQRKIISNTATTLTVGSAWGRIPDSTTTYCLTPFGGKAEILGNDFLSFRADGVTMIHELGHNLNLRHGGDEDQNYKPNYLSVMNYSHAQRGIERVDGTYLLDYSPPRTTAGRGLAPLPSISETGLDEDFVLDPTDDINKFVFVDMGDADGDGTGDDADGDGLCENAMRVSWAVNGDNDGDGTPEGVDWTGDGDTGDGAGLTADVDYADSPSTVPCPPDPGDLDETMTGHDDWRAIVLKFRLSGDSADSPVNVVQEPLPTDAEFEEFAQSLAATDLAISLTGGRNPVEAGALVTWTGTVRNLGPNVAHDLRVVDVLPPGLTYVSDDVGCTEPVPGTLLCETLDLSVGEAGVFSILADVGPEPVRNAGGPALVASQATVENLAGPDPDPSNDISVEQVLVVDTTPPVLSLLSDPTVECDSNGGAATTNALIQAYLSAASAVDFVDLAPVVANNVRVTALAPLTRGPEVPAELNGSLGLSAGAASGSISFFPLGATTVEFTATDFSGNTSSTQGTVNVVDTTPPVVTSIGASPNLLWPPNHEMVSVAIEIEVEDVCDPNPVCTIVSVSSDEPVLGKGSGKTAPDWVVTGALQVDLRAERAGKGDGREYTIVVECRDVSGNATMASVVVSVPHDLGVDSEEAGGGRRR